MKVKSFLLLTIKVIYSKIKYVVGLLSRALHALSALSSLEDHQLMDLTFTSVKNNKSACQR